MLATTAASRLLLFYSAVFLQCMYYKEKVIYEDIFSVPIMQIILTRTV